MNNTKTFLACMICLLIFTIGCDSKSDSTESKPVTTETVQQTADAEKVVKICGKCGEFKGSEQCCKPDAATCSKCGAHKGSPGCCKLKADKSDLVLCKCGEIKGTDACCNPESEKCAKCNKIKGSPGCCK